MTGIPAVLGAASFGTSVPRDEAFAILDRYAALGGRIADTANNYAHWHPDGSGGDSEEVLGEWLEQRDFSDFAIMTKIGSMPVDLNGDLTNYEGLAPEVIRRAAGESAARLRTDCIDLLMAHHDHPATPLLETWTMFSDLVSTDKVKSVGVSNYSAPRLAELFRLTLRHSLAPVAAVQVKYSLIAPIQPNEPAMYPPFDEESRKILQNMSPDTEIYAYSPLLNGLYEKPADGDWPAEYDSPENRAKVVELQTEAANQSVSTSALVLKTMVDDGIIPVTSTSKPERLESNLLLMESNGV
ncbi:MAG: aldo/keto reductase [Lentisphaeria bacterium]